jgi:glycosyltransferase involved in cell wall biosynthesis
MKISICVINKNSENTINKSLRSVLEQIDERFEVVVIDESTDKSPLILKKLEAEFPNVLKCFFYGNEPLKSIGAARNMSIIKATGTYCIMHIDCDDVWFPYINYFADVFLEIEKFVKDDFLLAGHQINMARRDFLISVGPYQDVKHGEDRDLWMRLAKRKQYMPLDHIPFFERLPLGNKTNKIKAFKRTYWSVGDEIRGGKKFLIFLKEFFGSYSHLSVTMKLLRIFFYPLAKIKYRNLVKLDNSQYFENTSDWNLYKKEFSGTFSEIAPIWGFPGSLNFLANESARKIFEHRRSDKLYQSLFNAKKINQK